MSWKKKVYNKLTWPGFPDFGSFTVYRLDTKTLVTL